MRRFLFFASERLLAATAIRIAFVATDSRSNRRSDGLLIFVGVAISHDQRGYQPRRTSFGTVREFGKLCPISRKAQVYLSLTNIFAFQAVAHRPCLPANELAGYDNKAL